MVCDGVLPIDQMREYTGPVAFGGQEVMREVLEATYGLSIQIRGVEEGGDGVNEGRDLLSAYAGLSQFYR